MRVAPSKSLARPPGYLRTPCSSSASKRGASQGADPERKTGAPCGPCGRRPLSTEHHDVDLRPIPGRRRFGGTSLRLVLRSGRGRSWQRCFALRSRVFPRRPRMLRTPYASCMTWRGMGFYRRTQARHHEPDGIPRPPSDRASAPGRGFDLATDAARALVAHGGSYRSPGGVGGPAAPGRSCSF